jgi:Ca2+-transporting ATPase
VLFPVHIVFLELIIDPACTLIFEAEKEEKDVMSRPPRDPKQKVFNRTTLGISLLQGCVVLAVTFGVYWFGLIRGFGEGEVRALTYVTLIMANLFLILSNRSWSQSIFTTLRNKNSALFWVMSGAVIFLILVLSIPFLSSLFSFDSFKPVEILVCLGAALLSISWFEIYKIVKKGIH